MLSDAQMEAWGWRLPFLVAAPARPHRHVPAARGWRTPRCSASSSGAGETEEEETKTQFSDLLTEYWKPLLLLGGLVVALNVVNYTLLSYMPTYLQTEIGLTSDAR